MTENKGVKPRDDWELADEVSAAMYARDKATQ